MSAVALSCAQQPIERLAVRLTVAIKRKLRRMPSIYSQCERALFRPTILPQLVVPSDHPQPQGIDNFRCGYRDAAMCHDPAILGHGGPAAPQPMASAVMEPSRRFHNSKRK